MKPLSLALLSLVLIVPTTAQGQEDNDDARILFADGTSYSYDEEFREWRDKTGDYSVIARFDRFLPSDQVRLIRKDTEKRLDIKIEILSPDDQKFLADIRKHLEQLAVNKKEREFFEALTSGPKKILAEAKKIARRWGDDYKEVDSITSFNPRKVSSVSIYSDITIFEKNRTALNTVYAGIGCFLPTALWGLNLFIEATFDISDIDHRDLSSPGVLALVLIPALIGVIFLLCGTKMMHGTKKKYALKIDIAGKYILVPFGNQSDASKAYESLQRF